MTGRSSGSEFHIGGGPESLEEVDFTRRESRSGEFRIQHRSLSCGNNICFSQPWKGPLVMLRILQRATAVLAAAVILAGSQLLAPTSAEAASKLTCRASVSPSKPRQYTTVVVTVKTGQAKASVRTVAHYKTTKTAHSAKSNSKGKATISYYISGATVGRSVKVTVTVKKNGKTRTCSTSFRPRRK